MKPRVIAVILALACTIAYPAQAKVKLTTVTHWNLSNGPGALLGEYVKEYNDTHDAVEVDLRMDSPNLEKVMLWSVSGLLPDILPISQSSMPELMSAGIMTPLPDFAFKVVQAAYYPGALEMVRFNDKLYGYPSEYIPATFTYDTVAFAAKGLPDTFPENWDGLIGAAKKLTEYAADGKVTKAGLGWDNDVRSNVGLFFNLAWTSKLGSNALFSPDFKSNYLDEPAALKAVGTISELVNGLRIATVGGSRTHSTQSIRWSLSHHRRSLVTIPGRVDEVRSARILPGENGRRIAPVYGWAYTVPPASKHVKEAYDFITWLTTNRMTDGSTRMGKILAELGSIPATRMDISYMQRQIDGKKIDGFLEGFISNVVNNETMPWPAPPNSNDVWDALNSAIKSVISQGVSPQQAMGKAKLDVQNLINDAMKK